MNVRQYGGVAAAIAIALGSTAFAQQSQNRQQSKSFQSSEQGQRAMRDMSELDRDRDQRLSQEEAQSRPELLAAWTEIDVTRDGSLDATEYYLYAAQRRIDELEGQSRPQSQARSGQSSSGQSSSGQSSSRQSSSDQSASGQSNTQSARGGQSSTSTRQSNADDEVEIARADRSDGSQQSPRSGQQPSFDDIDRNNDGQIDRQEYQLSRL